MKKKLITELSIRVYRVLSEMCIRDSGYSVLEEIKVLPNVTYVAKLRNILEPLEMGLDEHKKNEKKTEENKKTEGDGSDKKKEEHK